MPRRTAERTTSGRGSVIDLKTGEPVRQPVIPVLCERIRYYRKQKGLGQKAFGAVIGAAANTVNNWEMGRTRPDVSFLPAICRALGISLQQLYGLEAAAPALSEREERLIGLYRALDAGHRYAVDTMAAALLSVQQAEERQRSGRRVLELPLYDRSLAAGVGDPTEYEGSAEPFYLYDGPLTGRADCVFRVSGDSMEPLFRGGTYVLVERIPGAPPLREGETGAFAVGNELYIKEYRTDGLHSANPRYPVMTFGGEDRVYLIGRVLGAVEGKDRASEEDIRLYRTVQE